jgi:hypothetical protein
MKSGYIAKDAKPCMIIVTGENAPEQVKYAASELRYYLSLITTANFEIADKRTDMPCILLQRTDNADLGEDGFTLTTEGDSLFITGGKRGVIYGAYEFLERLGCRFFTPYCEKIPASATLELPTLNEKQVPVLEYREHNYTDAVKHTRFAVKCRLNGSHHRIREKHGGYIGYAWYVHTFERMVPPELYAKDHPEYYALVNGKRPVLSGRFQLCLTNPDVLEISIQSVRKALLDNPYARIISISQNDWFGNCQCPTCKKTDEAEGSPSGTLLRFVNAIAKALEPEFPHILFDTLAYQYTRQAPKITRPRHNVCVRLCSIECCFSHSFETCNDANRMTRRQDGTYTSFIRDLEDWGKVSDRLYIWDYTTCFAHYPKPHPNWNVLQPNIQAMVRNNVKGVFEQANGAAGGGTDLNELRAYIISKLLWNPYTDVKKHMEEFTDYYYQEAAPYIREYIKTLTDKVEKDNIHIGFNDHLYTEYLEEDMLDIYDKIFDKAEEAVKGNPLALYRVAKARLSLRYVRIKRKSMLNGIHDPVEIRDFFTDWQSFGLTRIDEWVSHQTTHRALLSRIWRGTQFYDHWGDEGGEEF